MMTASPHTQRQATGTAAAMTTQASRWLELLYDSQRRRALSGFPGEPERSRWFYVPTDHGGLTLAECTPAQGRSTPPPGSGTSAGSAPKKLGVAAASAPPTMV